MTDQDLQQIRQIIREELQRVSVTRLALTKAEAAKALGVGLKKVWELASTDQIARTSYGTYPIVSLEAHLQREMERKQRSPARKAKPQ